MREEQKSGAGAMPGQADRDASLPTEIAAFFDQITAMPRPVWAVVDGARYGDLSLQLEQAGLSGRSLFLEHADEQVERMGGWLVPVQQREDLESLYGLAREIDSMVFWSCAAGEEALYRHLRSINMVMIPDDEPAPESEAAAGAADEADSADGAQPPASPGLREQSVMFRHYDPSVLASFLPLLNAGQFARLLGPATYLMMFAPDYGGARSVPRPDNLPISPRGPLRFSEQQMQELEQVRVDASQVKIVQFLRRNDSQHTAKMNDHELMRFVANADIKGRALGLRSERALGYWAWLLLGSNGAFAEQPFTREYLQGYPEDGSPDDKIYKLMDNLAQAN
ncbi:DUF4123 domain-containing protein [Advenella mimigardefordensis]|nr:DUF4123 domain-containing protein [Advenella mimigardefordensis]